MKSFFLSVIRRCSLVTILYALDQQPVLTIEYLKGEFEIVPSLAGFSDVVLVRTFYILLRGNHDHLLLFVVVCFFMPKRERTSNASISRLRNDIL